MKEEIEELQFIMLKNTIKNVLGFESDGYTTNFLKRRISVRMRAKNIQTYKEYEELFKENQDEQKHLLKNLTIHVTEFFRDEIFWDVCKERAFKDFLNIFSQKKTINIWSAGCSSGQEAVSILITFLEINPRVKQRINIIGTDICEDTLSKARKFEYEEPFGTKGLKKEIAEKYFIRNKEHGEKLCLKEEYRSNFVFLNLDILKDNPIKDIDILFLRNTVIYFSKETKEKLYMQLYNSLNTPSFFILGKTEMLTGIAREKFLVYDSKERIFAVRI